MRKSLQIVIPTALAFLALLLAVSGYWLWQSGRDAAPRRHAYGTVPGFSLTERSGRSFGTQDLRGTIWIADFIFTSCGGPCPMMSARMAKLHEQYAGRKDLLFVSITVDPKRDTPEVLSRYADRYKASPDRWVFLTGKEDTIHDLATKGMYLAVHGDGTAEQPVEEGGLVHSLRFVLVDRDLQIQGYYQADDASAITRLQADVESLLAQKPS